MRCRLVVKPGITGLWQVNGRADLCWDEAVRLDLRYVENWSFMLDLQILWKTWSAITRGSGAYLSWSNCLRSPPQACRYRLCRSARRGLMPIFAPALDRGAWLYRQHRRGLVHRLAR